MIWKINRHNIFVLVQVSFLSVTMFVIVHHHLDIVHHLYDNYLLIVHLLTPVSLHPTPRAGKLQSAGHLRMFSNKFLTFTCYLMIELQSSCFNFHLLQNRQYCFNLHQKYITPIKLLCKIKFVNSLERKSNRKWERLSQKAMEN